MTSESMNIHAHGEITSCAVSDDVNYKDIIAQDTRLTRFDTLLSQFLLQYFKESEVKPTQCIFTVFSFPGEDYREPMVKVIYPDSKSLDILHLKDILEENFKRFLAKNTADLSEFKALREIQRIFRFIIRRG